MLYNRYNDNNHNTTSNTTIAIVFLEIFAFLSINATFGKKRGFCRLVEMIKIKRDRFYQW
jgi:hypothetical protein